MNKWLIYYILIYIFIIKYINGNETKKGIYKNNVLNLVNVYYVSFYCKDNICVSVDVGYADQI